MSTGNGQTTNRMERNGTHAELERLPPHNRDAERGVLGSILRDNRQLLVAHQVIRSDDFYVFGHQEIFKGMLALTQAGSSIDYVTLSDWLKENNRLEDAGGHGYLVDLWEEIFNPDRCRQYAEIVRRFADVRTVMHAGLDIAKLAAEPGADPAELREQLLRQLGDLGHGDRAEGYRFEPVDIRQLVVRARAPEWAVKRVLVMGQTAILGGPRKVLKTSIAVDLGVSIATGTSFLGTFTIPQPRRVCLVSGESGDFVILDVVKRVCAARQMVLEDGASRQMVLDDILKNLSFHFRLPQLANPLQLREMAKGLKDCGAELVILDPLYLALLAGVAKGGPQASNIFDMGPVYNDVAETCFGVGCTPILAHHFNKAKRVESTSNGSKLDDVAQPNLSDLAFAGVQEYAAQWLLLGRREPYQPGRGEHLLWLVAGGRVGHSGAWGVDVDEGQLDDDFQGRKWAVQVLSETDAITGKDTRKRGELEEKRRRAEAADDADLLRVMDELDTERAGVTQTRLSNGVRWGDKRTKTTLERLVQEGIVDRRRSKVPTGSGAEKECTTYRRALFE